MRLPLALIVILAIHVACNAQGVDPERVPIQPDPAIHERFDKILAAMNIRDEPQDNIEVRREIKDLKDAVADKGKIVRQLVVYASGPEEEQPLLALMILQLLDLPPRVIIPELAPYLNDEDVQVQEFVSDWFRGHDSVDPSKDYRDYVGKAENVPAAFAQYLFESSPNRAFLVFVRAKPKSEAVRALEALRKQMDEKHPGWDEGLPQAQADRGGESSQARPGRGDGLPLARAGYGENKNELLLAEHVISNAIWLREMGFDDRFPFTMREAKMQLSQLSEHELWWVRLYVAETMRQNPDFRQDDVLEKLSRDDNNLVSNAAKSTLK
jgi:hypothetical protein